MSHATPEVTADTFEADVLQSSLPVLVDFTADWCPPCKMIAPIVSQLGQKYEGKLRVVALDADAHPEIIQRYFVQGLPTLILFQNGEPVKRMVGYQPREKLDAQIAPYLNILT
jgi:thioredoxin 1